MGGTLPDADEVPELVAKPGGAVWRHAGDARLIGTGAYAILLQVAHPTVGAGVSEHSDFRADPWGRLLRTLDYSYVMTYGGPPAAAEMGARIRDMHRRIRGVKPDGGSYHALEPEAYAWVHATLADAIVRGHRLLCGPLPPPRIEELYSEWRRAGRLIGIRERDLPSTWGEFGRYFDGMVGERLERTAAVDQVLEALDSPIRPPLPFLTETAWRAVRIPVVHQARLVTEGLLPARLRDLFGIDWGRARRARLRALAACSRAATPLLPRTVRNVGPSYLRWRREAIAPGDAAAPSRLPAATG
jgi:uncharacterized protein (DUF2236 family)